LLLLATLGVTGFVVMSRPKSDIDASRLATVVETIKPRQLRAGGRETTKATPKPSHSKITMREVLRRRFGSPVIFYPRRNNQTASTSHV
jgi:hypothetical protein